MTITNCLINELNAKNFSLPFFHFRSSGSPTRLEGKLFDIYFQLLAKKLPNCIVSIFLMEGKQMVESRIEILCQCPTCISVLPKTVALQKIGSRKDKSSWFNFLFHDVFCQIVKHTGIFVSLYSCYLVCSIKFLVLCNFELYKGLSGL